MSIKLLTEHSLEFVSLKGGCTGSSESTLVKIPHCVAAQFMIYWLRADAYDTLGRWVAHSYLKEKEKFRQVPQIKFFMHAVRRFMLEFIEFFFHATHEKGTQLCNYVLFAKSALVRQATAC